MHNNRTTLKLLICLAATTTLLASPALAPAGAGPGGSTTKRKVEFLENVHYVYHTPIWDQATGQLISMEPCMPSIDQIPENEELYICADWEYGLLYPTAEHPNPRFDAPIKGMVAALRAMRPMAEIGVYDWLSCPYGSGWENVMINLGGKTKCNDIIFINAYRDSRKSYSQIREEFTFQLQTVRNLLEAAGMEDTKICVIFCEWMHPNDQLAQDTLMTDADFERHVKIVKNVEGVDYAAWWPGTTLEWTSAAAMGPQNDPELEALRLLAQQVLASVKTDQITWTQVKNRLPKWAKNKIRRGLGQKIPSYVISPPPPIVQRTGG